jgi:hypothetical protein
VAVGSASFGDGADPPLIVWQRLSAINEVDAVLIPPPSLGDHANDPCNYRSNLSRATDVGHERVGEAQGCVASWREADVPSNA